MPHLTIIISKIMLEYWNFEWRNEKPLFNTEHRPVYIYPEAYTLRERIEEEVEGLFQNNAVAVIDNDLWIDCARVLVKEKGYILEVIEWTEDWKLVSYPIDQDGRFSEYPELLSLRDKFLDRLL